MSNLTAFPFLSEQEFVQACEELQHGPDGWSLLAQASPVLRMTKLVSLPVQNKDTMHEDDDEYELDETDEDALPAKGARPSLVLTYDVLLSPSYRVPVVYLQTKMSSGDPYMPNVEQLCQLVVPEPWRDAVGHTGVYGALSMTDHPITALPTYFVHPCRTADALIASSGGNEVSPLDYMMLWFGVIGTSVGLSLPMETALRLKRTKVELNTCSPQLP